MKNLLAAIVLIFPMSVFAQQEEFFEMQMKVICGETKTVLPRIAEYGEKPIFIGTEGNGITYSVWHNQKTNTFTSTKTSADKKYTCIVAVGTSAQYL
jgi:hypothetical protein